MQIDQADGVGIATAHSDIGGRCDVTLRSDVERIGPQACVQVAFGMLDLRAVNGRPGDLVIAVLSRGRYCRPARKTPQEGPDLASPVNFTDRCQCISRHGERRDRTSERLATRTRLPARSIATPAAPAPASMVATRAGGEAFKSMIETLLSGAVFLDRPDQLGCRGHEREAFIGRDCDARRRSDDACRRVDLGDQFRRRNMEIDNGDRVRRRIGRDSVHAIDQDRLVVIGGNNDLSGGGKRQEANGA